MLEGRASSVATEVEELSAYLVGKDPHQIEDHWTVLYRGGFYRGGGLHMSALAGIGRRSGGLNWLSMWATAAWKKSRCSAKSARARCC